MIFVRVTSEERKKPRDERKKSKAKIKEKGREKKDLWIKVLASIV